jgi:hypothetical protein
MNAHSTIPKRGTPANFTFRQNNVYLDPESAILQIYIRGEQILSSIVSELGFSRERRLIDRDSLGAPIDADRGAKAGPWINPGQPGTDGDSAEAINRCQSTAPYSSEEIARTLPPLAGLSTPQLNQTKP